LEKNENKMMNKVFSIKEKKIDDIQYVGIVYAKDWFEYKNLSAFPYHILRDDFVVCKWLDFHDGQKSNIEGMTTIAICKELKDAELIFNSK
jgi:hypothetical protein